MIVTCVHVSVKPECIEDFIKVSCENHRKSILEKGNLRFDVLQSPENPAQFLLYEAYDSAESAAAHKETEHYHNWRESVASYMAEPRKGVKYNSIAP